MQIIKTMIVGILGKGGSGKSTIATLLTHHLLSTQTSVLAIDADHNMDLAYNLGYEGDTGPYLGGSFLDLRNEFGLDNITPTEQIFTTHPPTRRFTLTPPDSYTEAHSVQLRSNLRLMMSGPQHAKVLHGQHCSHSLAAPLKIYLPLLTLQSNEWVVVDEKASVDAVSTGIPTGFDVAIVVAEPRLHSLRAAQQISNLLSWYEVPFCVVLNKVTDTVVDSATAQPFIPEAPAALFTTSLNPLDTEAHQTTLTALVKHLGAIAATSDQRLERTIRKYKRNEAYTNPTSA